MLVLARQLNERIVMPSVQATIEVVAIRPNSVRLGIDAPPDITILREEVLRRGGVDPEALIRTERDAGTRLAQVRHVLRNRLHTLALGLELMRQQSHAAFSPELEAMLGRMEDEVRTLDQQLRTVLREPLDEAPEAVYVEAGSPNRLDGLEGGLAI
jgi:carbon storage regulator